MRARVPVVKFVDCGTGIECDISVENKDGISRSSIFAIVSSIDERFRILSHLVVQTLTCLIKFFVSHLLIVL